jgi:hypothetical protein
MTMLQSAALPPQWQIRAVLERSMAVFKAGLVMVFNDAFYLLSIFAVCIVPSSSSKKEGEAAAGMH